MKNPFRSEADAFRLVIGAVVYFGAIAIAAVAGGRWWGLGVFVVLSAAVSTTKTTIPSHVLMRAAITIAAK